MDLGKLHAVVYPCWLATPSNCKAFGKRFESFGGIFLVGTPEQRRDTLVTLSLRNVPMTEAIRYVGQLSGTHIKYEEHAIVADPNYRAQTHPALEKAAAGPSQTDPVFGQPAKSNVNGANLFD